MWHGIQTRISRAQKQKYTDQDRTETILRAYQILREELQKRLNNPLNSVLSIQYKCMPIYRKLHALKN